MSQERRMPLGRHPGAMPRMGGGPGPGAMMPGEKPKEFKKTMLRLLRFLKPYRMRLLLVLLSAIAASVFSIVGPKLLGHGTDIIVKGVVARMNGAAGAAFDYAGLLHVLGWLAGLYVLSFLFGYVQQYLMAGVTQGAVYRLRKEVDDKLQRLPLQFYDAKSHGDILSRVVNDVDNISGTLQQSLTQLITSAVTLVGVIVMMLTISPLLTLIVFVTLPLSFLVTKAVAKRSQKHFAGQQRSIGELNGHVEEMFTGHRIVKAFGREKDSLERFEAINGKLYQSAWRAQFISGTLMPLMSFVGNLGYVLISVVGGLMVTRGGVSIGDIQAFIQYARQFTMPITQLANIANIIQSTAASAERVFELLDEQEEEPDGTMEAGRGIRGDVAFESVDFGYKPEVPLMKGLSIEVKSGQTAAIVGPTGAGKTTLVNLLLRFYELDGGRITIDGRDIRQLARGSLRSLFGMVLQDTWLYKGTIRDNIAYGRREATDAEIEDAARAAHADFFIRTLPEGYETVLNEDASNLSQGQKQLITIARALLADPAILILDEATSSVDTRTEVQIRHAMKELMKGRTSFVIAHRLSTIRDADVILVMDKGSVAEQGTHEELIARGGIYAELYRSQFSGNEAS
ncbi:ATP-binding cassette, subfamily B [Paenibacillus sp. RU4T]|uniref:ABC transporter ATP-binding protein n=1 Tax=unclassified Paenibacillus TaxID=185978 RepID=UPI0009563A6E|nr:MULTISPECIES: ABC transporter ATP-binding protein [unclassified Paenibacillus]SIQ31170.1 ATP-binding cassette, subfamily B [Paenibacillus sp. RU4X]SIQ52876.1 ATP-binding cassette, subfamily B [Paenibacillus sp. RU4T]